MISGIITAVLLLLFIGGWIWVWRPERKAEFDAAARVPLAEDEEVKS
ncbi:MAG TPA: CcoQ/FixQ family Cbb3-type cytochrome c oxidase assembly chaperone [Steroidobacteraceae bacterium]|nr:CcoQ/FixQ family Cbb3-type cytochrome c oxidase assembly chaperone [Steroidobacteraceae bacterium]